MHVHIHRAKIQTMKQSVGPRHSPSELTLALVLGQASETPPHKPGINPVMPRYLGSLGLCGSRVKGGTAGGPRGAQGSSSLQTSSDVFQYFNQHSHSHMCW